MTFVKMRPDITDWVVGCKYEGLANALARIS